MYILYIYIYYIIRVEFSGLVSRCFGLADDIWWRSVRHPVRSSRASLCRPLVAPPCLPPPPPHPGPAPRGGDRELRDAGRRVLGATRMDLRERGAAQSRRRRPASKRRRDARGARRRSPPARGQHRRERVASPARRAAVCGTAVAAVATAEHGTRPLAARHQPTAGRADGADSHPPRLSPVAGRAGRPAGRADVDDADVDAAAPDVARRRRDAHDAAPLSGGVRAPPRRAPTAGARQLRGRLPHVPERHAARAPPRVSAALYSRARRRRHRHRRRDGHLQERRLLHVAQALLAHAEGDRGGGGARRADGAARHRAARVRRPALLLQRRVAADDCVPHADASARRGARAPRGVPAAPHRRDVQQPEADAALQAAGDAPLRRAQRAAAGARRRGDAAVRRLQPAVRALQQHADRAAAAVRGRRLPADARRRRRHPVEPRRNVPPDGAGERRRAAQVRVARPAARRQADAVQHAPTARAALPREAPVREERGRRRVLRATHRDGQRPAAGDRAHAEPRRLPPRLASRRLPGRRRALRADGRRGAALARVEPAPRGAGAARPARGERRGPRAAGPRAARDLRGGRRPAAVHLEPARPAAADQLAGPASRRRRRPAHRHPPPPLPAVHHAGVGSR